MSLYKNISNRRKEGKSRSKKKSTISPASYKAMTLGFPNSKKNKRKRARNKS